MVSYYEYGYKSYEQSDKVSAHHLRERVLAQHHARRAHHSGNQNEQAQPPRRVEIEYEREGENHSRGTANGGIMYGDFPPFVYRRANDLDDYCHDEDYAYEVWGVEQCQQVVAREIAHERDDIRYHPPLTHAQLLRCPSLIAAVEAYEVGGQHDREQIEEHDHQQLVNCGEHAQIAERKQEDEPYHRQIERCGEHAHDS